MVLCRKLRWICRKHSSDVERQVETPSKRTISVARQIYLVARHNFHVALVVTLYHDCKTSKCCNRCIFSLTACEQLLRHVALCCAAFVRYITSQSSSNFTEPLAWNLCEGEYSSTQKFDNECDVIFMFKM